MGSASIDRMARHWYGHGQWQAPYWFIGSEPGMAKEEGDDLRRRCQAWLKLGGADFVDCIAYHEARQITKWHEGHSPPQPTWRQLIRLLLSFQGKEPSREDI